MTHPLAEQLAALLDRGVEQPRHRTTAAGELRAHRDRVRRLTPEEIDAIEDGFSNEFGLEAKYSQDFARAIETALAAKWGVALDRSE